MVVASDKGTITLPGGEVQAVWARIVVEDVSQENWDTMVDATASKDFLLDDGFGTPARVLASPEYTLQTGHTPFLTDPARRGARALRAAWKLRSPGTRMSRLPHSSSFLGCGSDTATSSRRNVAQPARPTDALGALHERSGLPALACLVLLAGCGSRTGLENGPFDGGRVTVGDGDDAGPGGDAGPGSDAGPALSPWPLYQRDRAHSGRSPFIGPAHPALQWAVHTDGSIDSPVIGADGTIYFCSGDAEDSAFNLHAVGADGVERWTFPIGSYPSLSPAVGGDGTVYVGSADNHLYAVAPDGTQRWDLELGDVVGTPTLGSDGTLYVGSLDKHVYAIGPGGTVVWSFTAEDGVYSSPAIGSDGALYFGAWANYSNPGGVPEHLYAVNPDGSSRWAFPAAGVLYSPALGGDGTIYVRAGGGTLDAVSPAGTSRWTAPVDIYSSAAPAVAADGTIYIGSGQGQLSALGADGHVKWVSSIDDVCSRCAPTIGGDGTIYLLAYDNNVYALDPDGNVKWTFQPSASSSHTGDASSVVLGADGTLYFGDDEGDLFAVNESP